MRCWLRVVVVVTIGISSSLGAEFTTKIVDALGRPLDGVEVHVTIPKMLAGSEKHEKERLDLRTNADGMVKGHYDEKLIPKDESVWVYVGKEGYESYSTSELRPEYVLRRQFRAHDVRRIVRMQQKPRLTAMKELLAGEFETDYRRGETESLQDMVFYYERDVRPALRSLVSDPQVGMAACKLLAFIGDPKDLRLVIQHAPEPKKELFEDRWAYGVVTALLEPATEKEWAFLKKCAFNEFDDGWVDFGAIQTLRLIASPRSLGILREAQRKNPDRKEMIDGAIEYVQANQGKPVRLSNVSLLEAGKKVAAAVKIGNWEGNEEPKYNADEDMALITCEFIAGRDQLTYTATFHRVGNEWKLRGVRETMQALLGMPPDRKTFVGVWHGYCESRLQFARLELNDDSRGFLALSELRDSTPFIYRVIEWKPRGSMVEIGLEPVGTDPEPIELKNVTHSIDGIELEVHGKGWWRKLTLFKEDEFQRRAEDVKKNLEKVRVVK